MSALDRPWALLIPSEEGAPDAARARGGPVVPWAYGPGGSGRGAAAGADRVQR